MLAVSYSDVRKRFQDYCEKAAKDFETIIITRQRGDNGVLMSEAEYNNLMENLYVRSNPVYYNVLINSIEQLKKAKRRNEKADN